MSTKIEDKETVTEAETNSAVDNKVKTLLFGVDSKTQANDLLQNNIKEFEWVVRNKLYPNFFGRYLTGENCLTKDEIKFILDRKSISSFVMDGIADGRFPLRVTHNDTKLDNIMMDPETGEGRCVIDLDTVMPGSVLADFGDAIRFGASSTTEDETDLDKVYLRLDLFEGFAKGFIEGLEGALTKEEILSLPMGAYMLAYEQSIRFLGDYLNGDVYFRTHYPEHNLVRARNQMKLVADMESKMDEMNRIVKKYI